MKRTWYLPLLCVALAGCGSTSSAAASSASSSSSEAAVKQGCDAFEECVGSTASSEETASFKEEYEQYNGTENDSGKTYRTVTIPEDNPMKTVSAEEVVERIENGDTFYVYFGDALCPWCRSVIETAIDVSQDAGVDEIDYVDIWDESGNEVLRDTYEIQDGETVQTGEGTEAYQTLLQELDSVLDEYTLTDDDNEYDVGEKRIYAPNYIYIEDGKAVKLVSGISDSQEDAWGELSDEMLQDEKDIFTDFFNN